MSSSVSKLTTVDLVWIDKRIENQIRFGNPAEEFILGPHRRRLSFRPGSIFAFVRWTSPDFGVSLSRIDILRTAATSANYTAIPYVYPGGQSLLRLWGGSKVERVLQLIDAIEDRGIDPVEVAADYWQHVHNRLLVNELPRHYTLARHRGLVKRSRSNDV